MKVIEVGRCPGLLYTGDSGAHVHCTIPWPHTGPHGYYVPMDGDGADGYSWDNDTDGEFGALAYRPDSEKSTELANPVPRSLPIRPVIIVEIKRETRLIELFAVDAVYELLGRYGRVVEWGVPGSRLYMFGSYYGYDFDEVLAWLRGFVNPQFPDDFGAEVTE